jgi:light-harvesting protein B-800-850 alpha chain
MNNGRLWCVVNPTIGIPLLLGAVAGTSLLIHLQILNSTGWLADYYKGIPRGGAAAAKATVAPVAMVPDSNGQYSINVTPVASGKGTDGASFVVTVTPKVAAPAGKLALSGPPAK